MKRFALSVIFIILTAIIGLAQSNPPITIRESDGTPKRVNPTSIVFPNGSLTISGGKVTVALSGVDLSAFSQDNTWTGDNVFSRSGGFTTTTNGITSNVVNNDIGSVRGIVGTATVDSNASNPSATGGYFTATVAGSTNSFSAAKAFDTVASHTGSGNSGIVSGGVFSAVQSGTGTIIGVIGNSISFGTSGSGGSKGTVSLAYGNYISFGSITGYTVTYSDVAGLRISDWIKGAGTTVTTSCAICIDNSVGIGTTSYAINSLSTSPTVLSGDFRLTKTVTTGGTTGAQTINKNTGTINFAASAASLVVTNSLVTTSSIIQCTVGTNDTTMKSVQCVAGSGSFTVYPNAVPTAETRVNFTITN